LGVDGVLPSILGRTTPWVLLLSAGPCRRLEAQGAVRIMTSPARRRGWLALAVSLVLHGALVWALTALPGRTARGPTYDDGPVTVAIVQEEPDGEPNLFLVPHPAKDSAPPAQAANSAAAQGTEVEIAVKHSGESVVPAAYQSAEPSGMTAVDPALSVSNAGIGTGMGNGRAGSGAGTPGCFALGTPARSVVYVIDRSASMGPGGLFAAAAEELHAALVRLPATTQFQVILYHDQAELLLRGRTALLPATTKNVRHASQLLDKVRAEGGTNHLQALRLALSLAPEMIYLLTDADDLSDADRREVTRLNVRTRAVIHTIELNTSNRNRTDMPLQVLARENRGRYQAVDLRR
jgi:von Willebrand factor type A domain